MLFMLYFTETEIELYRWSWCMKGFAWMLKQLIRHIDEFAYLLKMLSLSKLFLFWLVN